MKTAPPPTMPVADAGPSGEHRLHAEEESPTADRRGDRTIGQQVAGNEPANEARPGGDGVAPKVFLLERLSGTFEEGPSNTNGVLGDTSTVIVAVVRDPDRLLRERGFGFHGDVIDLLTDLVIGAMDQDPGEGSSA